MINHSVRYKDGCRYEIGTRTQKIEDAIAALFEFELGYGGFISNLDEKSVQTTTHILGCRDVTTFSFTEQKEKETLYELLAIWNAVNNVEGNIRSSEIDLVMKITKGIPLMVKLGSGIIIGRSRLSKMKIAMVLSIMAEEDENKITDLVNRYGDNICKEKFDNITAAYVLNKQHNVKPQEAIELLLATPVYNSVGKIESIALR